ncbi:ATP/GTP-binding protein [Streptomyces rishiriensis]|uniref:ATP/GTP-binding protein n=1 Tax=Streptomyces rishiriensis TaxID=68264 RepID=UPI00358E720C
MPFWARDRWTPSRLRGRRGEESSPDRQDEAWHVRQVSGASGESKTYRCPGCDQMIPPGVPHVVAWPRQDGAEDRRHWHKACWNARDRARVR